MTYALQLPPKYIGGAPRQLSESEVVALAREHTFGLPVGFFVGMALRESGFTANQVDTDLDSEGNPRPNKTYGLLMLRRDEAAKALSLAATLAPESIMVDPAQNLAIGAQVFARYRNVLEAAAAAKWGLGPYRAEDISAHVGLAHNWGLARETRLVISRGIDGAAFAERNATEWPRQARYVNTIMEYVGRYPEVGRGADTWFLKAGLLIALAWGLTRPGVGKVIA